MDWRKTLERAGAQFSFRTLQLPSEDRGASVHLIWQGCEAGRQFHGLFGRLLSRLVHDGRLQRAIPSGRHAVCLACDPEQSVRQWQQRQQEQTTNAVAGLPSDCLPGEVIEVLRQMILHPDDGPQVWGSQLQARGLEVTLAQFRKVIEHYGLRRDAHNGVLLKGLA